VSRRRKLWIALLGLAAVVVLALVAGLMVVRSNWFYEKLRARIIETVETATGGRVELGGFAFDWRRLRVEVRAFTIHGTEPADRSPLFHADTIAVGLKIVSALKRDVDIQYLDVMAPRVYLIVYPDGRTNVPEPKVKGKRDKNAAETILDLAIGRFSLQQGVFEVESRGKTPFDARGRDLGARFAYEAAGPRYRGTISAQTIQVQVEDREAVPASLELAVAVERNRVAVSHVKLATGATSIEASGTLEDFNAPRAAFQYEVRVSIPDIARVFKVPELKRGEAQVGGSGSWSGKAGLSATGNLRAANVEFRDSTILLRYGRLEGALTAHDRGIDVAGARIAATYFSSRGQAPAEGRIAEISVRDKRLELRGVALAAAGGSFHGQGLLRDWKYYTVTGDVAGFDIRTIAALYSPEPLPWDGLASGPVRLDGNFKRKRELKASGKFGITPAPGSAPVEGQVTASFDAESETIDLGHSTLRLPASRAEFSGVYGRELRAHLESTDLNDLLPLLGKNASELPVKLQHGSAVFDGTVTGKLEEPQFAGHLTAKSFTVEGRPIDTLDGEVTASPANAHLWNATATRGALRASFDAQVALDDWKTTDASRVFGNARIENAAIADLLAAADVKDVDAKGTVSTAVQLTGTVGAPILKGDLAAVKGSFRGEPFDRVTAGFIYANDTVEVNGAQAVAGPKQAQLTASYHHAPGKPETGRLHFQVRTNAMPLADIATVQEARPGVKGTLQVTGNGDLDLGAQTRIDALHADVVAKDLQLTGQTIGDARLAANTEGRNLRTVLDANFANSTIHGDGTWKLEGDYPGSATVTFSRLDFAQLRAWLAPAGTSTPDRFGGYAEGEMRISGPALKPEALTAELRLPKFEIGPTRAAGVPANLALHNEGPIVASLANNVLTIRSARLTGRATDVTIGGRVLLRDTRNPLDVRVNGKIDVSVVQDFNPDFVGSGELTVDAGVRGAPDAPQITGRMQVRNAALNVVDFPNGISNANGSVLFTGDRATIEKITGETGGGNVELSGFVSFPNDSLVFQLEATARQVRVRYPEGVSTVANADLRFAGTSERSTLGGTITILRTGFNPQSDFSSIISSSSEPVRTPPARTGLLGGIHFDVQIETAPDIQFQSALTQDLQVDANLRLKGTASNPALLGRINITQGQVVFYGTRYTINQGSISFFNPLKIDPIFDIDLETKARGIDVTLTVSGPLNKLNLTPRSDPPLQFNEIVALLATGRTPTSDPSLLAQQATAPQSWQQMGASALLGQAIANPVAGRLQRFFGVSNLRIDPTLPGIESNPQARLTVEQQVTPDIVVTYVTNVTNSNPQVVRVEWSVSKQWSVVVLREENGVASLDFFYKKRF
jgi:translocation and assembly module TamB